MKVMGVILDDEQTRSWEERTDVKSYRLESSDGETCYARSTRPPVFVVKFCDRDGRPHTVERIEECSHEELKGAWEKIGPAE